MKPETRQVLIVAMVLVLLTFAVYWRVMGNEFIKLDDDDYVYANPNVQQGITLDSLRWAFNAGYSFNWHPLTWISHMVDYRLFGLNPMGHHLVNLIFHILNTVLLLLVLRRMTGSLWKSAFVAALFAVHPLHVESVAWVAERKDVLSTFFWLLTMGAYVLYSEKPSIKRYLPVIFLYALGLMAKPMLVTLPIVLLLMDYWPLDRIKRGWSLIWEKLPLLAMAAGSSAITVVAQYRGGAISGLDTLPVASRISGALIAYVSYIGKMLWPAKLAVFYPLRPSPPIWMVAGAVMVLAGISVFVLKTTKKKPYVGFGWLWYVITLLPVIGLVQVGLQSMADRYTYVPLIGLFTIIAWGVGDVSGWVQRKNRLVLPVTACLVIAVLAIGTWIQVGYWHDSVSLFERANQATEGNFLAHLNLGWVFCEQGRSDDAIMQYNRAIAARPEWKAAGLYNIGVALYDKGNLDEAVRQFREAIRLEPDMAEAHCDLGLALKDQDKTDEAIVEYRKAIGLKPDFAAAHNNLAVAYYFKGRYADAWEEVYRCRRYGGSPIPDFINALEEKMPDPGGSSR